MRGMLVGLLVTLALAASPAARADDDWLLIGRVGLFFPRVSQADDLLVERTQALALQKSDWDGVSGGLEVGVKITGFLELGQHLDAQQAAIDRTPDSASDASSLLAETVVFGLTARLIPTRPGMRFAPYLAVGPDLVIWRYEETVGDSAGERKADGTALGFHAAAGLRVFLTHSFALSAEYRRQFAADDTKGDFTGSHIDLTGSMITLGLTYRF
jgi:opacity protein-like surface antigen